MWRQRLTVLLQSLFKFINIFSSTALCKVSAVIMELGTGLLRTLHKISAELDADLSYKHYYTSRCQYSSVRLEADIISDMFSFPVSIESSSLTSARSGTLFSLRESTTSFTQLIPLSYISFPNVTLYQLRSYSNCFIIHCTFWTVCYGCFS